MANVDKTQEIILDYDVAEDLMIGSILEWLEARGRIVHHTCEGPGGGNPQLWILATPGQHRELCRTGGYDVASYPELN